MKKANLLLQIVAGVATILGAGVASAQQYVYVSDALDNSLSVINTSNNTVGSVTNTTYLPDPTGLAMNNMGDLFIANTSAGDIVEYDTADGVFSNFASGLSGPTGLAFDSNGNLYVANMTGDSVTEFIGGSSSDTHTYMAVTTPYGLAVDSGELIYVTDGSSNLSRIFPDGSSQNFNPQSPPLVGPEGITFDPTTGDLVIANNSNNTLEQVTTYPVGSTFLSNSPTDNFLDGPRDAGFALNGDLYVTDYGNNTVTEYLAGTNGYTYDQTFTNTFAGAGPSFIAFGSVGLPVPEPGTYGLLIAGMVALYFVQRRRSTAVPVKI